MIRPQTPCEPGMVPGSHGGRRVATLNSKEMMEREFGMQLVKWGLRP